MMMVVTRLSPWLWWRNLDVFDHDDDLGFVDDVVVVDHDDDARTWHGTAKYMNPRPWSFLLSTQQLHVLATPHKKNDLTACWDASMQDIYKKYENMEPFTEFVECVSQNVCVTPVSLHLHVQIWKLIQTLLLCRWAQWPIRARFSQCSARLVLRRQLIVTDQAAEYGVASAERHETKSIQWGLFSNTTNDAPSFLDTWFCMVYSGKSPCCCGISQVKPSLHY